MDPESITQAQWSDIGSLLTFLIFVPISVISAALTILLAHGIVPSLVATGHLPQQFQKLRPGLYLTAAAIIGVAIFMFVSVLVRTDVIEDIYTRWWI